VATGSSLTAFSISELEVADDGVATALALSSAAYPVSVPVESTIIPNRPTLTKNFFMLFPLLK